MGVIGKTSLCSSLEEITTDQGVSHKMQREKLQAYRLVQREELYKMKDWKIEEKIYSIF